VLRVSWDLDDFANRLRDPLRKPLHKPLRNPLRKSPLRNDQLLHLSLLARKYSLTNNQNRSATLPLSEDGSASVKRERSAIRKEGTKKQKRKIRKLSEKNAKQTKNTEGFD